MRQGTTNDTIANELRKENYHIYKDLKKKIRIDRNVLTNPLCRFLSMSYKSNGKADGHRSSFKSDRHIIKDNYKQRQSERKQSRGELEERLGDKSINKRMKGGRKRTLIIYKNTRTTLSGRISQQSINLYQLKQKSSLKCYSYLYVPCTVHTGKAKCCFCCSTLGLQVVVRGSLFLHLGRITARVKQKHS